MRTLINKVSFFLLLSIAGIALASCELDGPLAIYKIVVNENPLKIQTEIMANVDSVNYEFAQRPCEKDYAVAKFKSVCADMQRYFDENRGKLIWSSFSFDVCLYNMSSHDGGPEGLLVDTRTIDYCSE
ncbi:MAG: hypothetical protein J6V00_01995 [Bacteroidaceae bacterium]|nr:hypothetical protein [Bacteroidaceae bacterium]